MLLASVGIVRFPDVYSRIHALGVSGTLGIGCVLLASSIYFGFVQGNGSIKEVSVIVVLFLTSPVSVHLLSQAAYRNDIPFHSETFVDELNGRKDEELV